MNRRYRLTRVILAAALALPLAVSVRGGAFVQPGCILRGGFFFDAVQNEFGRYPVVLDLAGNCFDRLDLSRDIPIHIRLFLVGSAQSLGRCTGGETIDGLDLNGFYFYDVEGESATINVEADLWANGRYVFPGMSPFKLMIRYDGTQPSISPLAQNFAAGLVTSRAFGMCPNGGDPRAVMYVIYSRQP